MGCLSNWMSTLQKRAALPQRGIRPSPQVRLRAYRVQVKNVNLVSVLTFQADRFQGSTSPTLAPRNLWGSRLIDPVDSVLINHYSHRKSTLTLNGES
jgi:hypothetical protein